VSISIARGSAYAELAERITVASRRRARGRFRRTPHAPELGLREAELRVEEARVGVEHPR
jgi:hypothetical protein